MIRRYLIRTLLFFFALSFLVPDALAAINKEGKIDYDISVHIDPITRSIEGRSIISVEKPGELMLILGRRFEVTHATIDDRELEPSRDKPGLQHIWHIPFDFGRLRRIEIHWQGKLTKLDTSLDHQQTLGRAEPVSGEMGTFLPKSSNWYPMIADSLASYRVNLALPSGQRGLVAGQLLEESDSEQGYQASFEFSFPSEGIDLMAGPYEITTDTVQGNKGGQIQLRTYFHPQIKHLARGYIDSVKDYLALYESWIGAYPFTEFSVVSSPTPTGFGMPTLTYLGISVLQLPFIRATSLGHEVLHNWWGNGVYPDYMQGNWSEGLTTFMADYAYKERESAEAAREMRLGWLRDFAALAPGQDLPLVSFTSRTHGASKIVGYNKTAMLFFMLRDQLGEEIFNRAIQAIWNTQRFKVTSWDHLQRLFEMVSGQDLQVFFDQWLEQPGAPAIHIAAVDHVKSDSGHQLAITLEQSMPAYQLRVPVVIRSAENEKIQILDFQDERQTFNIEMQARPLEVTLDPDLRLFRQLASNEAPPILREVMVNQATETILLPKSGEALNVAKNLASKLQHRSPEMITSTDKHPAVPMLVIGLQQQIDAWLMTNNLPARPESVAYKGSAQAWTFSRPNGSTLAIVSARDVASLESLIRPLPHYGRQSYVIFDGRKMIEQGAWPVQVQTVEVN
jgi:aminopeptidase N